MAQSQWACRLQSKELVLLEVGGPSSCLIYAHLSKCDLWTPVTPRKDTERLGNATALALGHVWTCGLYALEGDSSTVSHNTL